MRSLLLALAAVAVLGFTGASADLVEQRTLSVTLLETFGTQGNTVADGDKTHYGDPHDGCMKDEQPFQINGVSGAICAPMCTEFRPCPADVPDGVTAEPTCALKSQAGDTYCALICDPNAENGGNGAAEGEGECGDAKCQPISGTGICTYDTSTI